MVDVLEAGMFEWEVDLYGELLLLGYFALGRNRKNVQEGLEHGSSLKLVDYALVSTDEMC